MAEVIAEQRANEEAMLKSIDELMKEATKVTPKIPTELPEKAASIDAEKMMKARGGVGGGGDFDDEDDPLNTAEVLAAVAKFSKQVKFRDSEIVRKRSEKVKEVIREAIVEEGRRLEEEEFLRKKRERESFAQIGETKEDGEMAAGSGSTTTTANNDKIIEENDGNSKKRPRSPSPTMNNASLPNSAATGETSRRMVSNLPAWMMTPGATEATGQNAVQDTAGDGENGPNQPASNLTPDPSSDPADAQGRPMKKPKMSAVNRDINERRQKIGTTAFTDGAGKEMSMADIREKNQKEDREKKRKEDLEKLSTEKILELNLDFAAVKSENGFMGGKLNEEVRRLTIEYLGEEEESLVTLITEQLTAEVSAAKVVEELEPLLDEEAEAFVAEVWKLCAVFQSK